MQVSVIGTGRMGGGLVRTLAPRVPGLMWGSRSEEQARRRLREIGIGEGGVRTVGSEEALEADVIIHALWFRDVLPWAAQYEERLAGKILVDIANPFTANFEDFTLDWGDSAAERLQAALPRTRVVGAFKNTFWNVFEEPIREGLASDVFVTSDDEEARRTILGLLQGLPFRAMDGGRLRNNRTIERMTLFERELAIRNGHYPYVSWRLFGMEGQQPKDGKSVNYPNS